MEVSSADRQRLYNNILRLSLEEEGSVGISQIEGLTTKNLEFSQVQNTVTVIEKHLSEAISARQFDSLLSKALSSLGFIFTGLWQAKHDPEELNQCCNTNLVNLIIELLEVCELEHQLLVLVVISNQLLPQFFGPYTEVILGFIRKLLSELNPSTNNAELIVQQCVATLSNISTQSQLQYKKYIDVKIVHYLLSYLFSKVSSLITTDFTAVLITPETSQVLRDLINLLYAVPVCVLRFFVVHTLKEYDALEQVIKQLVPKAKDQNDVLQVLTDLWCLYMRIVASLLVSSDSDTDASDGAMHEDNTPPAITPKDIDRARKRVSSISIYQHLHEHYFRYEHASTGVQQNERPSTMSYVECKVCMHDLVAPPSSVGKLMVAVQSIMSVSRKHASICYAQLCQHLTQDKTWYLPHYVWKLLLRCVHHLLFTLPPALSSADNSSEDVLVRTAEDVASGVKEIGDGLAAMIARLPLSAHQEVLNVEVSVKSAKPASSAQHTSNATVKVSLQVLLDMLAHELDPETNEDDDLNDSTVPTKRQKLDNQGGEESMTKRISSDKARSSITYERCLVYTKCISSLSHARMKYYGISRSAQGVSTGLFSYLKGFRKVDIIRKLQDGSGANKNIYDMYMPMLLQRIFPLVLKTEGDKQDDIHIVAALYQALVLLQVRMLFAQLSDNTTNQQSSNIFASSQALSPILLSHPTSYAHNPQISRISQSLSQNHNQADNLYHYTQFPQAKHPTPSHTQSPAREEQDEDQVVLARVHPLANETLSKVLGDSLKLLTMIGRAISLNQAHFDFMVMVVEAVWWILHRLSSFATEVTSLPAFLKPFLKEFMDTFFVSTVASPTSMAGLATILLFGTFRKVSSPEKVSLMCEAINCSMNSLTESGSLSHVISILYQFFYILFPPPPLSHLSTTNHILLFDNSPSLAFNQSIPALQVFVYVVKAVLVKLASLTAPNASESLSVDILLNLRSALRSALMLPCYLVNITGTRGRPEILDMLFSGGKFLQAYQYLTTIWYTLESRSLDYANIPDEQDLATLYPLCVVHMSLSKYATARRPSQYEAFETFLQGINSLQSQFHRCYEAFAASTADNPCSPPDLSKNSVYFLARRMQQLYCSQIFVQLVYLSLEVFETNGKGTHVYDKLSSFHSLFGSLPLDLLCITLPVGSSEVERVSLKLCACIILLFTAHRLQHNSLCHCIAVELVRDNGNYDFELQNLLALLGIVKAEFLLPVSGADIVSVLAVIEAAAHESRKQSRQPHMEIEQLQLRDEKTEETLRKNSSHLSPSQGESVAMALDFSAHENDRADGLCNDEIDLMVEDDTANNGLHDSCSSPATPKDELPETVAETSEGHKTNLQEAQNLGTPDEKLLDRSRTEREAAETLVARFGPNNAAADNESITVERCLQGVNVTVQDYLRVKAFSASSPNEAIGKLMTALQDAQRLSFLLSQELDEIIKSAKQVA